MSIELKIKSKHLSVEAKIIRFEEHKLTKQIKWLKEHQQTYETQFWKRHSLNQHRKVDVRNENRATFLARAFIAGKPYSSVEQKRNPPHNGRIFIFAELYPVFKRSLARNQYAPPLKHLQPRGKAALFIFPSFSVQEVI